MSESEHTDQDLADTIDEAVSGYGNQRDARVNAVLAMYAYLRKHGTAERKDLLRVVDVDATGYDSEYSFWANCVRAGNEKPNALRILPGVTYSKHRYWYSSPDSNPP